MNSPHCLQASMSADSRSQKWRQARTWEATIACCRAFLTPLNIAIHVRVSLLQATEHLRLDGIVTEGHPGARGSWILFQQATSVQSLLAYSHISSLMAYSRIMLHLRCSNGYILDACGGKADRQGKQEFKHSKVERSNGSTRTSDTGLLSSVSLRASQ